METEGQFSPPTAAEARDRYEACGSTAQVLVREVAKAMGLDADEYERRVTGDVIETARDVLFAESLQVHVGTTEEFESWHAETDEMEVTVLGSENVERVVWHAVPFADEVVAATYHEQRDAAVGTLRRQVFGRVYREVL